MMKSPKKSRDLDYHFGIFWKILRSTTHMQSFIRSASLVQDLWRGGPFNPPPTPPTLFPLGYLMSKKPNLVRVN